MLTVHVYNAAGVFPQARKQLEICRADGEMLAVLGADRLRLALAATHFESGEWDKTASQLGKAETELDRLHRTESACKPHARLRDDLGVRP